MSLHPLHFSVQCFGWNRWKSQTMCVSNLASTLIFRQNHPNISLNFPNKLSPLIIAIQYLSKFFISSVFEWINMHFLKLPTFLEYFWYGVKHKVINQMNQIHANTWKNGKNIFFLKTKKVEIKCICTYTSLSV